MTAYRAESDALAQLVAELDAATAYADGLIADIQATASGVVVDWSGEASRQYQAAHSEWAEGAQAMSKALAAIHANVTNAAGNYAALSDTVRGIWG